MMFLNVGLFRTAGVSLVRFTHQAPRPFLKFLDRVQAEGTKIQPAFLTTLVKKARNKQEVQDLVQESEQRFGKVDWRFLASCAYRVTSLEIRDPDASFAVSLLQRIPSFDLPKVHIGTLRAVLIAASHQNSPDTAKAVFDMIPLVERTPNDGTLVIQAGIDSERGRPIIVEIIRSPCTRDVDVRVLATFLKCCASAHDIVLGERVWQWGEISRSSTADTHSLALVTSQMLTLVGRTSDIVKLRTLWDDTVARGFGETPETVAAMLAVLAAHGSAEEIQQILQSMNPEKITQPMLLSALAAYAHTGNADGALNFLHMMKTRTKNNRERLEAYTTVVDAFARKGDFEKALQVVDEACEAGLKPDSVMWMAILSPCRRFRALDWAQYAFAKLQNSESIPQEMLTSAYVVMADVLKACGDTVASVNLHEERKNKGLLKERGAVVTTIRGRTFTFHVGEIPTNLVASTNQIQAKLDEWAIWLTAQNVTVESIRCKHSEKLALAYAVCEGEKIITLRKNLRICSACHAASVHLTRLEGIKVLHWDMSRRVHVMENGRCSCGDYY